MRAADEILASGEALHAPSAADKFLYQRIYSELRAEILAGKYKEGDCFPPERALKERFATTHLTVRSALAKLVLDGFIERYSGKGTFVIYSGGGPSAEFAPLRFSFVSLILENLDDEDSRVLESLESRLRRLALPLRVSFHRGDPDAENAMCEAAAKEDALIILRPLQSPLSVLGSGIAADRIILIGDAAESAGCARIFADASIGAREAVRHCFASGHDSIALVLPPTGADSLREGWREELSAAGLAVSINLSFICANTVDSGAAAAGALLARNPGLSAFLCGSDRIAAGVARTLREKGIDPGLRSSVIGCGNTALAEALGLASIDKNLGTIGELVVAAIAEGARRGHLACDTQSILSRFVIRPSCRQIMS